MRKNTVGKRCVLRYSGAKKENRGMIIMKKKIAAIALSALTAFGFAGCGGGEKVNTEVPEGTEVILNVEKENGNKTVFGVGTELDPHFFSQNVGLSGYSSETGTWTCREEDWELFEQRMEEMNLKRIRVMLLPSWYVINEANTAEGVYNWDSDTMQSLYRTLDTAKQLGMKVNITMWGIDTGTAGYMRVAGESAWVTIPDEAYEQTFVDCFADCIKYLIEEKEYDCISEVTLYNEPNSLYGYPSYRQGVNEYCDLCTLMNEAFETKGIRDKVLFNLSDDARDYGWMANVLMQLEGVIDVANSHTYDFGDSFNSTTGESDTRDMSNDDICYNNPQYNLEMWRLAMEGYEIPHMWGEFGTQNGVGSHTTLDKHSASRGLDIPRISLNFFNMGSVGMSYWVLFSQYYSRSEANGSGNIMDMGLWGFADENYNCRPVYYSYSMITRFIEAGDVIFPIQSSDENIVAVAFRDGKEWSYAIVNNGDTDKTVGFVNYDSYPTALSRYEYDEANVPTDNKVIGASGELTANGRVISDTVKARSFVIYTNK